MPEETSEAVRQAVREAKAVDGVYDRQELVDLVRAWFTRNGVQHEEFSAVDLDVYFDELAITTN